MKGRVVPLLRRCLQRASRFPLSTRLSAFSSSTHCIKTFKYHHKMTVTEGYASPFPVSSIRPYGTISCQCRVGNMTFFLLTFALIELFRQHAILDRSINTWDYHTYIISLPSLPIMCKKTWGGFALHKRISKSAIIASSDSFVHHILPIDLALCKITYRPTRRISIPLMDRSY